MNIGFFNLSCIDTVEINLFEFSTKGDVNCILRLSYKDISKIDTNNEKIQSVIELIKVILIIKNPTNNVEPQAIPIKFSLDKGSFYINKIPIYQLPTKY